VKNTQERIALQDYYSPCCGSCAQRLVVDNKKGQYTALQVSCKFDDIYSAKCSPMRIGTQKQIMTYKNKKINSISYYRPVYDTTELIKLFPNLERELYIDDSLESKPILPLTKLDSILIDKYLNMTSKRDCEGKYINLIRGFIYVGDGDMKIGRPQKIKFKSKSKSNGS
jgi:hypothetical protein